MLANLSPNQLEYLTTTNRNHRLDVLIKPTSEPTNGLTPVGFETAAACQSEDRIRARALRALKPKLRAGVPDCNAATLADLLDNIADPDRTQPLPPCLASAVSMRGRRIGVLGAILELVAEHPELDTAWITGTHPALRFDHNDNWGEVVGKARTRFQQQLATSGAMAAPGIVIAYLAGYFERRIGRFQLQFRGIAGGEKLKCVRQLNGVTPDGERPICLRLTTHPISSLERQIAGIMPNFLAEVTCGGKVSGSQRMSEPYHSIYLMWLIQRSLADLWMASGVFYLNGRLAVSVCDAAGTSSAVPAPALRQAPTSARGDRQKTKKRGNESVSRDIADLRLGGGRKTNYPSSTGTVASLYVENPEIMERSQALIPGL